MKLNYFRSLLVVIACCLLPLLSYGETVNVDKETIKKDTKNILIVYLTRTANTEVVAQQIHQLVGGNLVEIETVNPYPSNYAEMVAQARQERDTKFKPSLKPKINNIQKYDIVFVGFPIWSTDLPAPMRSFLTEYDFSGKTVIPFCTNGGYGEGSSFKTIAQLVPQSTLLKGFAIKGGSERDGKYFVMQGKKAEQAKAQIKAWLRSIGMLN